MLGDTRGEGHRGERTNIERTVTGTVDTKKGQRINTARASWLPVKGGGAAGFTVGGAGLTQVPVGDGVVVVFVIVVVFAVLDAVALVLLGDRAGAVEARPDVLLVVRNGLVFLRVPLVA